MAPYRQPPSTTFERVANFRDLGGHTTADGRRVRRGRLYRSGHLGHASDRDIDTLAQLGVRRVFDFRTVSDIEMDGADRLPEGTGHIRLPMPDPAMGENLRDMIKQTDRETLEQTFGGGRAEALMMKSAAGLVRERIEPYSVFLRELARDESVPALFHCSAGKDRAGWAGTIVLLALGVEEEQVIEQYLLSNREIEGIRARLSNADDHDWGDVLQPLIEVRVEYIRSSFEVVHEDWGSFDRYLHEGLGISEEERERLRAHFLE